MALASSLNTLGAICQAHRIPGEVHPNPILHHQGSRFPHLSQGPGIPAWLFYW